MLDMSAVALIVTQMEVRMEWSYLVCPDVMCSPSLRCQFVRHRPHDGAIGALIGALEYRQLLDDVVGMVTAILGLG